MGIAWAKSVLIVFTKTQGQKLTLKKQRKWFSVIFRVYKHKTQILNVHLMSQFLRNAVINLEIKVLNKVAFTGRNHMRENIFHLFSIVTYGVGITLSILKNAWQKYFYYFLSNTKLYSKVHVWSFFSQVYSINLIFIPSYVKC